MSLSIWRCHAGDQWLLVLSGPQHTSRPPAGQQAVSCLEEMQNVIQTIPLSLSVFQKLFFLQFPQVQLSARTAST